MPTVNIYLTDDAWVWERLPDDNFNNNDPDNIFVGVNAQEMRAWLQFGDLSAIPAGSTINNADIFIGCFQTLGSYSQTFELCRCTENLWDEAFITWNNAPNADVIGTPSGVFETYSVGTVSFDVTADVAAALADNALSYRIHNPALDGSQLWIWEEAAHPGNVYLVVDYTVPAAGGNWFFSQ